MTCKQVRTEIALWVGNDLEEGEELRVERHLAGCPLCRDYAQEMKTSLQVLLEPQVPDVGGSLWPRLSARIAALESDRRLERFNGWFPAVAVVAASVAIIVLLESRQPAANEFAGPAPIVVPYSPEWTYPRPPLETVVNPLIPQDSLQPEVRYNGGSPYPPARIIFPR